MEKENEGVMTLDRLPRFTQPLFPEDLESRWQSSPTLVSKYRPYPAPDGEDLLWGAFPRLPHPCDPTPGEDDLGPPRSE